MAILIGSKVSCFAISRLFCGCVLFRLNLTGNVTCHAQSVTSYTPVALLIILIFVPKLLVDREDLVDWMRTFSSSQGISCLFKKSEKLELLGLVLLIEHVICVPNRSSELWLCNLKAKFSLKSLPLVVV